MAVPPGVQYLFGPWKRGSLPLQRLNTTDVGIPCNLGAPDLIAKKYEVLTTSDFRLYSIGSATRSTARAAGEGDGKYTKLQYSISTVAPLRIRLRAAPVSLLNLL